MEDYIASKKKEYQGNTTKLNTDISNLNADIASLYTELGEADSQRATIPNGTPLYQIALSKISKISTDLDNKKRDLKILEEIKPPP